MSDTKEITSKNLILPPLLFSEDEENQEETGFFPLRAKNIIKQRLSNLWLFGRLSEKVSSNPKEIVHHIPQSPAKSCIACESDQCCQNDINFEAEFVDDTLQSSNSVVKNDNSSQTFYGVSLLPGNSPCEEGIPLVFSDKKDALRAVRKYKGARFKPFSKKADALAFASQSADEICPSPMSKSPLYQVPETNNALVFSEKTFFKGPKSQEMVKLRKAIESGDEEYFKETVWSNPRYLISSGDTPAIMQEGFRYNGLHVAAKYKQPHLCQLIIDTIENPKFMELLYYDDSEEVRLQRIEFITDLYLNTPDKGLCEIPLHFAAKFGCLEAVEILASHPICDKTRQNKYGLAPKDIICERCPATSEELKKQIEEAFDDRFFVPVLRSDDNSTQPMIGEPYSPRNRKRPYTCSSIVRPGSPRDPFQSIKAVAGPMSPKQAKNFYQMWKTPPSSMFKAPKTKQLNWLRLADTEKGLECIGRYIAQSVNTHWTEYWPSLKAWCNLSSKEGLQMLEDHLKNVCQESHAEVHNTDQILKVKGQRIFPIQQYQSNGITDENFELEQTTQYQNASTSSTNSSGISQLCCKLQKFHFDDSGDDLLTSPDMPNVLRSCNASLVADSRSSVFTGNWDAKKHEEHMSSTTNINDFLLGNAKQEDDFRAFDHLNDSDYVNGHAGHLHSQKDKSSTPKCRGEGNEAISFAHSKTASFTSFKSVVCSLMEVLLELSMNAESVILKIDTLQTYLWDIVYSHVEYMLTSDVCDSEERSAVHCNIALSVFKEAQESFMKHEINLLKRCLASYLESEFSAISSDDENPTDRECSVLKQKLSSFRKKTTWKHLTCILTFLCEYLSNSNFVDKLISSSCHCEWFDQFVFSDCCAKNPVLKCDTNCSCINTASKFHSANIRDPVYLKRNNLIGLDDRRCVLETDNSEEDEDSDPYVTPPSSPVAASCCDTFNKCDETDEDLEVYVHGPLPSKADVDMVRVIEHIYINPVLFPHVARWKCLVMSFDKQTIDNWPSPAGRNFHLRNSYFKSKTPYSLSRLRKFEETGSPLKISTSLQGDSINKCLFQISSSNIRNLLKEFSGLEECAT